jgi:predicted ATPase
MQIKVKNFGPIRNVDIRIKPMTVIIGKNNLGKSYTAQLFYVLLSVLRGLSRGLDYDRRIAVRETYVFRELEIKRLVQQVKREKLADFQIVNSLASMVLRMNCEILQKIVKLELERAFGMNVSKLINITASSSQIECDFFRGGVLQVELKKREQVIVEFHLAEGKLQELVEKHLSLLQEIRQKRQKQRYFEELADRISHDLFSLNEELMPTQELESSYRFRGKRPTPFAYYVPAGRGGLMESFDTIVDSLIYVSPLAPVYGMEIPPLPGMAAQFFTVLRGLSGFRTPTGRWTSRLFKELLEGDIRVVTVRLKKGARPVRTRMIYRFQLGKKYGSVDLIHAASMIKELAPVYLLVQQLVHPGQFLIIEEPESHLHPGAQCKFATILATLAAKKVSVFVTTHSTVVLRKLAHSLRVKAEGDKTLLSFGEIAMYWLKDGKYGSTAKPLRISKRGILDEIPTFDEVVSELYEEEVKIDEEVRKEENRVIENIGDKEA